MIKFKTRTKKNEADEPAQELDVVELDGVKVDTNTAEVVYSDEEKDLQVVAAPDVEDPTKVNVFVMTASADEVTDEEVLSSTEISTAEEEAPAGEGEGEGEDESKKKKEAFRARLAKIRAKKAESKKAEAIAAARKRFLARKAAK